MNPIVGRKPYIVASRQSDELLQNLLKNDWPILFEGLHTTALLDHPQLSQRIKMVRTHNVEHHYYKHLESIERNYFKKYFFRIESEKLRKYQKVLSFAQHILAISKEDMAYFKRRWKNISYIPPFHSNEQINIKPGKGSYALYHGNLGVGENFEAALFLIHEVFSKTDKQLVIAGNRPPKELQQAAANYSNVYLKQNISTEEIHQLISDAQVNVLFTNQNTGIKLKLINVLYRGRYALVNPKMVNGTGLEPLCCIAKDASAFRKELERLFDLSFHPSELRKRQECLKTFDCRQSAISLLKLLPS